MTLYLFLSQFGKSAEEVGAMDADYVDTMCLMHGLVRQREKKEMDK